MEQKVSFWKSKRVAAALYVLLDIVYLFFVILGGPIMPLGQRLQLLGLMLITTILYILLIPENFYQNSSLVRPHLKGQIIIPSSGKGWLLFGLWAISTLFLLAPFRLDVNYQISQNIWYYESTFFPVIMFGLTGWQIIISRFKLPNIGKTFAILEEHINEDQN